MCIYLSQNFGEITITYSGWKANLNKLFLSSMKETLDDTASGFTVPANLNSLFAASQNMDYLCNGFKDIEQV